MIYKRVIFVVSVCLVCALAAAIYFSFSNNEPNQTGPVGVVVDLTPSPTPVVPAVVTPAAPQFVADVPVPEGFEGFDDLSSRERVALVTEYMENSRLPDDIEKYFIHKIQDKSLSKLVRNNMAESLVIQAEPIPGLADIYLSIVQDENESKDYRLYSIQHFAMSLPTASNRHEAETALENLVLKSADEDFGTRAMLMVDYIEQEGEYKMEGLDSVISDRIEDESLTDSTRISLFALIGLRKLDEHLELVRSEVHKASPIRRAAIAALGQIGDRSDIPLLRELASSPNMGVSLAAKGAIKRLESSIQE